MLSFLDKTLRLGIFNSLRKFSTSGASCSTSVLVDNHNDIRLISLNRPLKRNSLNLDTLNQLKDAFLTFDNDPTASVAVLHGEGGTFCSGFDIDEIIKKGYEPILNACEGLSEGPLCKKPVVAGIDGFAVGEGFELALACDLRVIEDTSSLGFLGRRYGAPTLLGGVQRLSNLIGASRTLHLICSGFQLTGEMAHTWGLASRVVSTGTCIGQAVNLAISVAKYPQNSVIHDKMELYKHLQHDKSKWACQHKDEIAAYRTKAIQEIEKNAVRFKQGIGKHGKFRNLKEKELFDWEKENEISEKM